MTPGLLAVLLAGASAASYLIGFSLGHRYGCHKGAILADMLMTEVENLQANSRLETAPESKPSKETTP